MRHLSFLLFSILLMGCVSQPAGTPTATSLPSTAAEAQAVLIQFFDRLNAKQYAEADVSYGGDYDQLQIFSPEALDHPGLWAGACERAGLQCLSVRTATFKNLQGDTYVFQVEFSNPDGSLFVLGPCCGADETEMPPVSQFEYRVSRNSDGRFRVMDLPPYTP